MEIYSTHLDVLLRDLQTGLLVAAKSVFRFGDLTDGTNRKNAEYHLIGTLMSFAYALTVSYGTRFVYLFLLSS